MELKIRAQDRKRSIPGICLPSIDQERIHIGGVFFLCRDSRNVGFGIKSIPVRPEHATCLYK
jgi:hypothetical protein